MHGLHDTRSDTLRRLVDDAIDQYVWNPIYGFLPNMKFCEIGSPLRVDSGDLSFKYTPLCTIGTHTYLSIDEMVPRNPFGALSKPYGLRAKAIYCDDFCMAESMVQYTGSVNKNQQLYDTIRNEYNQNNHVQLIQELYYLVCRVLDFGIVEYEYPKHTLFGAFVVPTPIKMKFEYILKYPYIFPIKYNWDEILKNVIQTTNAKIHNQKFDSFSS